jgi:hypothetical protein
MNCSEFQRFQDAYLDDRLPGSLRLEFDAHRLRCHGCQQQLALLEALEHTLTADRDVPPLSHDFAERVMGRIERRQPVARRTLPLRVAVVAGMMLQAAAVLAFAVLLQPSGTGPAAPIDNATAGPAEPLAVIRPHPDIDVYEIIAGRFAARVAEMHAAGQTLTTDAVQIARYLDITVPDVDAPPPNVATGFPLDVVDPPLSAQPAPAPESKGEDL